MHHYLLHRALPALLLAIAFTQAARAQGACTAGAADCAVVGKLNISLGLGGGMRTNPVRGNSDLLLPVIPHISYYGKRFFLENLELGYTLHESDSSAFSLIAAPGYDRAFFFSSDLQNIFLTRAGAFVTTPVKEAADSQTYAVSPRHTTYLVGPEWTFSRGQLIGQLNVLREVTGEHDGYEVRAALAAPIINADGALVASAGLTWKSARLVRYYYGVKRLYEPGSALNPFVKLAWSLPLSERWSFNAFVHHEFLDPAIAHSPVVSDSGVTTVFTGFVFKVL